MKRFNEQNKGQVTYREMPTDYGEWFEKLTTEFQVSGGMIDVTAADVIWTAVLAENDWIADVSNRFSEGERSRFKDGPIQTLTYTGGIYGVPCSMDAGMLYYRKDLLEKSGFSEPPETWEELQEMASKVVSDTGTRYGYSSRAPTTREACATASSSSGPTAGKSWTQRTPARLS